MISGRTLQIGRSLRRHGSHISEIHIVYHQIGKGPGLPVRVVTVVTPDGGDNQLHLRSCSDVETKRYGVPGCHAGEGFWEPHDGRELDLVAQLHPEVPLAMSPLVQQSLFEDDPVEVP